MCTVTYIPGGEQDFIFTSNRDEAPQRSATEMAREDFDGKTVLFPRDALAKGTWIAISDQQQLVCILNGAFHKHKHQPPYRLSRGTMALQFFTYSDANTFFEDFDFEGIEPFTMIIFDNHQLYEFRWDEQQKHIKSLNINKAHLWASSTLYPEEWQTKRKQWFENWQKNNSIISQTAVLDFHRNAGEGNPKFDVIMNWNNIVRTTSITSIVSKGSAMRMRYEGLLDGTIKEGGLLSRTLKKP